MAVLWIAEYSLVAAKVTLVSSYIALGPVLAINFRRPGIALVFIGAFLNFSAIAANGGAMPVAPETLGLDPQQTLSIQQNPELDAGFLSWSKDIVRSPESTRLRPLGDVFSLPGPFTVAYSAGDVFILIGLLVFAGSIVISTKRDQAPHYKD